jgi:hypothetical protein
MGGGNLFIAVDMVARPGDIFFYAFTGGCQHSKCDNTSPVELSANILFVIYNPTIAETRFSSKIPKELIVVTNTSIY